MITFFSFFKCDLLRKTGKLKKISLICLLAAALFFTTTLKKNNLIAAPAGNFPVNAAMAQTFPELSQNPPGERFKYLGWWGDINYDKAGIYKKPTRESEYLGNFTSVNRVKILEEITGEMVGTNDLWYRIDGGMYPGAYVFSADVTPVDPPEPLAKPKIPASVKQGEYWIDVDLTKKILSLFLYDKPVFATYVATGVYTHPTLPGAYKIWYKLKKTIMKGRPPTAARVYDLPDVPYVMYYRGSFSLHGTYWHDKFGSRQSSGCTNLTQGDAKFIFERVNPIIESETAQYIFSTRDNPGTIIYNHY